jgi:hypothetical protein
MSGLMYRPDMDEVRERLRVWWEGGEIGRPFLRLTAPREEPLEDIPALPRPEGWLTHYSTMDFEYRVNNDIRRCVNQHYLADAVPTVHPCMGPNSLALYLGCTAVEAPGTVWFEPCIDDPDDFEFAYDPDNFYWDFTLRLTRALQEEGTGKFLFDFPDLIEGLDTLGAMRGTEKLLVDLIERPDWVHRSLRRITDLYFHYYDILYDLMRDEVGGSHFWAWAPGRVAKLQCDISAMISPDMFAEFMVPVLREMCERLSYTIYHWDGPGALPHLDHLLSIPDLDAIQWTPGAGIEGCAHRRWWPLYHRILEAGKAVFVGVGSLESLKAMRQEFGEKLNRFLIVMRADSPEEAEDVLRTVSS